jgi:hypothetical protein
MRILLAVVLAICAGTAAASDLADPRADATNDFTGQVYYRVDFGGVRHTAQSLGLRLAEDRASAHGRPALFEARYGEHGVGTLAVSGVDLRGILLASQATEGGAGGLTVGQWVGIGFTALVLGVIAVEAADEDETDGTGGSGY